MKSFGPIFLIAASSLVLACRSHEDATQPAAVPSSVAPVAVVDVDLGAPINEADTQHLSASEDAIDQMTGASDFASGAVTLTPCTFSGQ